MKEFLGIVLIFAVGVMLIFGLGWITEGNSLAMFSFFAPKYERVRRETFEQSKAYNQGMAQELQNFYIEYQSATPEQKDAIASVTLHRTADYNISQLQPDLRSWIIRLRRGER